MSLCCPSCRPFLPSHAHSLLRNCRRSGSSGRCDVLAVHVRASSCCMFCWAVVAHGRVALCKLRMHTTAATGKRNRGLPLLSATSAALQFRTQPGGALCAAAACKRPAAQRVGGGGGNDICQACPEEHVCSTPAQACAAVGPAGSRTTQPSGMALCCLSTCARGKVGARMPGMLQANAEALARLATLAPAPTPSHSPTPPRPPWHPGQLDLPAAGAALQQQAEQWIHKQQ